MFSGCQLRSRALVDSFLSLICPHFGAPLIQNWAIQHGLTEANVLSHILQKGCCVNNSNVANVCTVSAGGYYQLTYEALNIFRAKNSNCLNCNDHISISSVFPQFKSTSLHMRMQKAAYIHEVVAHNYLCLIYLYVLASVKLLRIHTGL